MAGKKGPKAVEEKEAAVLEAQQREAAAEAAAAKQRQLDALFTPQPSLVVPHHDAASIEPTLHRLFFALYHPTPVAPTPLPALPSPPVEEHKETVVPAKARAASKARPSAKNVATAAPPLPPAEPIAPPPPPPRPADHPLSLLEQRWREHERRYDALEAELVAASALRRQQLLQHTAEMQSTFALIPHIDLPLHPAVASPIPSVELRVESLLDLSSLIAVAVDRAATRRAPIVRAMPKIVKRPSTRVSRTPDDDLADEEQRLVAKGGKRRSKGRVLKLTDRQRVAREVNAVAMSPILLQDAQRELQRLQQKRRFLLNPRHREVAHSPAALQADVEDVRWERWDAGGLYEQSVRVTNAGPTALRVTLSLPPLSSPFRVTATFPPSASSSNTLAPGMSLALAIAFRPTSLASLTDAVVLTAPLAAALTVPLLALRVPTCLTLPSVVELPPTLLSRTSVLRLTATNVGLASSFRLLTTAELEREQRGGEEASAVALSSEVVAGPFSVYPREFELSEGGGIQVTVAFSPQPTSVASARESRALEDGGEGCVSVFEEELCAVSDDGAVSRHLLRGEATPLLVRLQLPALAESQLLTRHRPPFLFSIEQRKEGGATPSEPSASSVLSFPAVTLGSTHTLCLQLSNPSPVPLPYQWLLAFNDAYSSHLPVFHLYPPSGTLLPYETRETVATFTPHGGEEYQHSAQLLINGEQRAPGRATAEDVSVAEVQLTGEGRLGHLTMEVASTDGQDRPWTLQRGEWGERRVRVLNASEVQLEYSVEASARAVVEDKGPVQLQMWPAQGRVAAGGAAELSVNVQAEEAGDVLVTLDLSTWPGGKRSLLTLPALVSKAGATEDQPAADPSSEVA